MIRRKQFLSSSLPFDLPNFLLLQRASFNKFLQPNIRTGNKEKGGLHLFFQEAFPIRSGGGKIELEFLRYFCLPPIFAADECKEHQLDYTGALYLVLKAITRNSQRVESERKITIYLGDIPLMTRSGSFIIAGTDRTFISKLSKAPGLYVEAINSNSSASTIVKIVPQWGPWLSLEVGKGGTMQFRVNKSKPKPILSLLQLYSIQSKEILSLVEDSGELMFTKTRQFIRLPPLELVSKPAKFSIFGNDNNIIVHKGEVVTHRHLKLFQKLKLRFSLIRTEEISESFNAQTDHQPCLFTPADGDQILTRELVESFRRKKVSRTSIASMKKKASSILLQDIFSAQKNTEHQHGLKTDAGGQQKKLKTSSTIPFLLRKGYVLSKAGRASFNLKVGRWSAEGPNIITRQDILEAIKYTGTVKLTGFVCDDVDHLENKKLWGVGEMIERSFRFSFEKTKAYLKFLLNKTEETKRSQFYLVDPKEISTNLHSLFVSSPLSQLTDQTNPLSNISHKRRLSSMSAHGADSQRASVEVRDLHHSHYGKICPVETPEGQNIGLINSLTNQVIADDDGKLRTPYRRIEQCSLLGNTLYLSASEEEGYVVAASANLSPNILARKSGGTVLVNGRKIQLLDACPFQTISVATSLIPFLEHNDVNRALMGSNMQRQAVPCLSSERPVVATRIEKHVAQDIGACITTPISVRSIFVDSSKIVTSVGSNKRDARVRTYELSKNLVSNQNTAISFRPTVSPNRLLMPGQTLVDSNSSCDGELALGNNVLVAFMPWNGCNFEDSIVVSEKLVRENTFSSVHIEELIVLVSEAKGRRERTTNVIDGAANPNLDSCGTIILGSAVSSGDIIVGKVLCENTRALSPEEKLLYAVFNEEAPTARNVSATVPDGMSGTVTAVRTFNKQNGWEGMASFLPDLKTRRELKQLERNVFILSSKFLSLKNFKRSFLQSVDPYYWLALIGGDGDEELMRGCSTLDKARRKNRAGPFCRQKRFLTKEELPEGIDKVIKISITVERKLQPGDKMSGRHGNKGVVSNVVPIEDMPYMRDGTIIDIILNPLGVPSRMNIGQIFEVHLGLLSEAFGKRSKLILASSEKNRTCRAKDFLHQVHNSITDIQFVSLLSELGAEQTISRCQAGITFSVPAFHQFSENELCSVAAGALTFKSIKRLNISKPRNQVYLCDGEEDKPCICPTTVGHIYYFKLHHLAEDKMHARSVGPYSAITQQPLGGKSQSGGQRFGEMEVWALEAYGAAYNLQEMLTVKSDDAWGRIKMYENIIRNNLVLSTKTTESFSVLLKEIKSLGIDFNNSSNE